MDAFFVLKPVPPFRLDLTVWALRRRADNIVDRWIDDSYRRVVVLRGRPIEVEVRQTAPADTPRLAVHLVGAPMTAAVKTDAVAALERLLGIRIELADFYRLAQSDAKLAPLAARFRGMKPPRLATVFEALVNAVACQQITLTQGIRLLNRLAEAYGPSLRGAYGFPDALVLAEQRPAALRNVGFSNQKAEYIVGIARAIVEGQFEIDALALLGNAAATERLLGLRGVGRWTAEYVLLRGLGRLDIFPGDDVGARNNLQRWLGLRASLDYSRIARITSQWQPYAGLVYFHLLLDRLEQGGYIESGDERYRGSASGDRSGRRAQPG